MHKFLHVDEIARLVVKETVNLEGPSAFPWHALAGLLKPP